MKSNREIENGTILVKDLDLVMPLIILNMNGNIFIFVFPFTWLEFLLGNVFQFCRYILSRLTIIYFFPQLSMKKIKVIILLPFISYFYLFVFLIHPISCLFILEVQKSDYLSQKSWLLTQEIEVMNIMNSSQGSSAFCNNSLGKDRILVILTVLWL